MEAFKYNCMTSSAEQMTRWPGCQKHSLWCHFLFVMARSFAVMNPTNAPYTFQWTCVQQEERHEQPAFVCFTERGQLRPEKRVEVSERGQRWNCRLKLKPLSSRPTGCISGPSSVAIWSTWSFSFASEMWQKWLAWETHRLICITSFLPRFSFERGLGMTFSIFASSIFLQCSPLFLTATPCGNRGYKYVTGPRLPNKLIMLFT